MNKALKDYNSLPYNSGLERFHFPFGETSHSSLTGVNERPKTSMASSFFLHSFLFGFFIMQGLALVAQELLLQRKYNRLLPPSNACCAEFYSANQATQGSLIMIIDSVVIYLYIYVDVCSRLTYRFVILTIFCLF